MDVTILNFTIEITSQYDVFTIATLTNNQSYSQWLSIIHIPPPRPGNPLAHWTLDNIAQWLRAPDTIIIIDVTSPIKIIEQANIKQLNLKGVGNWDIEIIYL